MTMKNVMNPGKLDSKTKMLIALTTSINNGLDRCIANYIKKLRSMGVTDDELLELIAVIDSVTDMTCISSVLCIFPQE